MRLTGSPLSPRVRTPRTPNGRPVEATPRSAEQELAPTHRHRGRDPTGGSAEGRHGGHRRLRSCRSSRRPRSCRSSRRPTKWIRTAAAAGHPMPRLPRPHALEQLGHQGPAASRCWVLRRPRRVMAAAGSGRQRQAGGHSSAPPTTPNLPCPLPSPAGAYPASLDDSETDRIITCEGARRAVTVVGAAVSRRLATAQTVLHQTAAALSIGHHLPPLGPLSLAARCSRWASTHLCACKPSSACTRLRARGGRGRACAPTSRMRSGS